MFSVPNPCFMIDCAIFFSENPSAIFEHYQWTNNPFPFLNSTNKVDPLGSVVNRSFIASGERSLLRLG